MGKYALVVGVAKRARDLKERESRLGPFQARTGVLINRALKEITDGKVRLQVEPED